ncbi:MAG: glycosyltransferase, partial [Planctomycetota bacterium]
MTAQRVGLTITDLDVGGAERCLTEITCRLDRTRFAPHVFVLSPPPSPEKAALLHRLEEADIPVTFFNFRRNLAFPAAIVRAARAYRRHSISLVQSFLFHANIVGRLAARLAGVPRVACSIRVAERRRRGYLLSDRLTSP